MMSADRYVDRTGRDPALQLEELRRAVAELIGSDPETWPTHGNAAVAIAATVALGATRQTLSILPLKDVAQGLYECCDFSDCPGVPEDGSWPGWDELPEKGRQYFRDFVAKCVVERDDECAPIHPLDLPTHVALMKTRSPS